MTAYNPIQTRIRAQLPRDEREQMEADLKLLVHAEAQIRRMADHYLGQRLAATLDLCADKLTVAAAAVALRIERDRGNNAD